MPIRSMTNQVTSKIYMEYYIRHILTDSMLSPGCRRDALHHALSYVVSRKPCSCGLDHPMQCGPCSPPWVLGVKPTIVESMDRLVSRYQCKSPIGRGPLGMEVVVPMVVAARV